MKFDPRIHHRRSIRLKGYDYRQAGGYFVTMVTQGRDALFGEVVNGEMILNDAGKMIVRWWLELPNKFPNVNVDIFVVMPNHFHGIIFILDNAGNDPVGDDLRVVLVWTIAAEAKRAKAGANTEVRPNGRFRHNQ